MNRHIRNRAYSSHIEVLITLFIATAFLKTTPAHCDETHLAIAVKEDPTGFEKRIRAELLSLGFEVTMVPMEPEMEPHETLETLAVEANASAAIRIEDSEDRVEIWVADRITGKLLNRKVIVSGDIADAHAVVAFAAIDLLRASLMELGLYKKEESKANEPFYEQLNVAVIKTEFRPKKKREILFLGLAPALVMGSFDTSPTFDILIDLHLKATPILGFSLLGYIPVSSSEFRNDVGSGTASIGFIGADVRLTLPIKDGRWRLNLAPGFGVLLIKFDGEATDELFEGQDGFAYPATPILRGGVSFLVVEPLHIRLDVLGGFTLKEIVARIGQEAEAVFGRPILAVNLGIDLRLW